MIARTISVFAAAAGIAAAAWLAGAADARRGVDEQVHRLRDAQAVADVRYAHIEAHAEDLLRHVTQVEAACRRQVRLTKEVR
jgi:hypothetical protein